MFAPYDPKQLLLMPPALQDWLPEDHLVHFISDAVDHLNLKSFEQAYRSAGQGNVPYHPRLMVKLLVYGYCTGVFSSRQIATQIHENIAFRVLAAGHQPSHRTIARFRRDHVERFQSVFLEVLQIAREAKLVTLGTVAIDGTKIKANASKHKAMSYGRMAEEEARLKAEIAAIVDAAEEKDSLEDEEFGPDFRGDELPAELARREKRLATIQAAKARLEERKKEEAERKARENKPGNPTPEATPEAKDQENFTDPESRIMKTSSGGFDQCYNAQAAVEAEHQLIVAAEVTQCATDVNQLVPMVQATMENLDGTPKVVLADAGYRSEENFQRLKSLEVEAIVPLGREGKQRAKSTSRKRARETPATDEMRKKMARKRCRREYSARKQIVEPVFGWVKQVMGFRRFSMRGLAAAAGEWNLVCAALNLRRLRAKVAFQ